MDSAGITKWIMSKTSFRGRGALTFRNGTLVNRHGEGAYHTYDNTYNAWDNFTTVGPGGDMHEYQLLEDETALVTRYKTVPYNLTQFGGPEAGFVFSCSFLRLNITSHEVLFEWDSIKYVPPGETFLAIIPGEGTLDIPWDYFHINSGDLHPNGGSVLLSARHTSALYNVNATTGTIIWRLGGKLSDFTMGNGTIFTSQHDARWISHTEISIFDNANYKRFWPIPEDDVGSFRKQNESRGIILSLDYGTMSCTLKQEYLHPSQPMSEGMGNMQVMDNGNIFLFYGFVPLAAEFSPKGELISEMWLAPDGVSLWNYRMFKGDWTGNPTTFPDVAVVNDTIYMSWNGATKVSSWGIQGRDVEGEVRVEKVVPKTGFETFLRLPDSGGSRVDWQVNALNADGRVLRSSGLNFKLSF